MGKKAKKKTRAPPREKRSASHSKNVSEKSSRSGEIAEDAVEAVKEKQSCVHFTKGVKLDKVLNKIKSSEHIKCGECKEGVHERRGSKGKASRGTKGGSSLDPKSDNRAIWVCLECGHYACGGVGLPTGSQTHVVRHIRLTRHRLAIQWENPQLRWCFPCHSLLPVEKEENGQSKDVLSEVVQLIKERSLNTSASADAEDLCSGSGSISSEIKSEGAVSGGIEARDGYVVRGLVNLGNTCFFNSIMQNLLSLDQLREHFLNEDVSGGGPLNSSLKKLFAETKPEVGLKSVINPRSFLGSVCSKAPQFRGYQQHDSHELLRCLLDGLSTEESSLRKKSGASDTDGNSTNQKPTLIDTVFGGEISSTVSCKECGHSSKVFEPFLDLSLPVPTKKPPPKKQQTLSRAKKTKLPPKRVPKTRAKVSKDSESVAADAVLEHLDNSFTGKASVASGDSSASGSFAPTSGSIGNGPALENHSTITPENGQASEITAQAESVFDSFWLDILGAETSQEETGLDTQDNDILLTTEANRSVPVPRIPIDAPVSSSDQTFEGGTDSLIDDNDGSAEPGTMQGNDKLATQSDENTAATGTSSEINGSNNVGGDPGWGQSSFSSVNAWDDEELPLQVADSQVLYMPYKEESSCTDKTVAEAEASLSFVSGGQEEDMDFDGFGGLFDEPEISEGTVSGPSSRTEVAEAGFMAVSSESDPEEIDDSDSPVSVERCLAHFTKPEILSNDNAWNCENCSKNLKLQRSREKKKAKNALGLGKLGNGRINENGSSLASHDSENDPSHRNSTNLENGLKGNPSTELSNCKGEKNVMDDGVLGDKNVLGPKRPPGDSCGVKDDSTTENPILEREAINPQLADDSKSEGSEDESVNSKSVTVKRDATKRVLINKAPAVLTIHLKRFSHDARGRLSKLNGYVAFKEFIDLRPYTDPRCSGEEKPLYRLAGVVEHLGTMRGGHYVAFVRGGQKGRRNSDKETNHGNSSAWYHVSDSYVRQVALEEVLRCEAYILFYERI